MKIKTNIDIDEKYTETEINIRATKMTDEIIKIITLIDGKGEKLTAIKGEKIILIEPQDIFAVYGENGKVVAETEEDKFEVRLRLYELEKRFEHLSFARISKSEIINIEKVEYFEAGFTGTLGVVFKNGRTTYVSRRYVRGIKERLGV